MRIRRLIPLLTTLALLGAAPGTPRAAEDNDIIVGRLGGTSLKAAELRRLLSLMPPEARKQLGDSATELEKVVRSELVRRAVLAEARERSFDRKPEVQFMMERGRDQALISAYVQSQARTPEGFPSEEQIKTAYDANRQLLVQPAQFRLSRIMMLAPSNGDKTQVEAKGKQVADLAARLQRSPEDFAKVAREHSDHKATAAKGGEVGWVRENQLTKEARAEVAKLDKGAVTSVIRTRDGWHIIRLLDKADSRPRTLEESRPLLVNILRQRWLQEQEKVYLENMLRKATPQIEAAELERLQESMQQ